MDGFSSSLVSVRRWPAPRIAPQAAAVATRLARRRQPLRLGDLTLAFGAAPAAVLDERHFSLLVGREHGRMSLPDAALQHLLALLHPAAASATGPALCLLLELALEPVLLVLERRFPQLSVALEPDAGEAIIDRVALGIASSSGLSARIELPVAAAQHVAEALDLLAPDPRPLGDLPISLAVRVGAVTLALAELRGLRPGDAVLPDLIEPDAALLIAGERFCWRALRDADALRVMSPRQVLQEIWRMSASVTTKDDAASLDELPVRLVFELGRLELTLAELRTLGPGHVFALGRDAHHPVDMLANGRRIGQGEIIAVGDAIGVRVTRLGDA